MRTRGDVERISVTFFSITSGRERHPLLGHDVCAENRRRYAWREPGTVAVEAITAFLVGPSCFILAYGMLRNRQWVLPLTKVLAVCQMYGVLVYFIPILPGLEVCRPEAVYRYVYLAFANLAWLFAPAAILWHTTQKVRARHCSMHDVHTHVFDSHWLTACRPLFAAISFAPVDAIVIVCAETGSQVTKALRSKED